MEMFLNLGTLRKARPVTLDINEETLSGMSTFHATQVAAFR